MKLRRRRVIWVLVLALMAFGIHWLMSPASSSRQLDPSAPTNLEELVDWIQVKARRIGKDIIDPPLGFLPAPALGPPGTLEVRVQEADGSAIEGVRLSLLTPPGVPIPQDLRTDAQGIAIWKNLPSAPGYLVQSWSREDSDRSVDLAAGVSARALLTRPPPRIEGYVVDAETRKPVGAATVALVPRELSGVLRERPATSTPHTVSTGPDGRFVLDLRISRGARLIATTSDGRSGTTWGDFRAGTPVEIRVRALRRIQGRVVDASGPRAGLQVAVRDMPLATPVRTDVEGRFSLETDGMFGALVGTDIDLVVRGHGVPRFEVAAPSREPILVEIPDASLDAEVRDADTDQALAGVTLSVRCGPFKTEATTDITGRARVSLSPDSIQRIHVLVPGWDPISLYPLLEKPGSVEPADGLRVPLRHGETRSVVLRMRKAKARAIASASEDAGSVLRLQVLDASGRPIPGVSASGETYGDGDGDGRLVLPVQAARVKAGEPIDVHLEAPGFRRRTFRLPVPRAHQVRDVECVHLDRLERRPLRILDEDGSPAPGWRVVASEEYDSTPDALSDASGGIHVMDPGGDYSFLYITSPAGELFYGRPGSGGEWALVQGDEIRIPPIHEIRVRIVDPVGAPIECAQMLVTPRQNSARAKIAGHAGWVGVDSGGTGRWKQIASFPLRVQARASGFVPASVDLAAGASETVIVLRRRDEAAQQRLREALAERDEIDRSLRSREEDSDDPKVLAERKRVRDRAEDRWKALDEEIERLRSDGWNH